MSKLQKSVLLATTALSLAAPGAVRAADAIVAAGQDQIEQVIVTATRREERLQNVPISITVFNQQQLSNHNVVNAADIAAYTPSMGINTDFGSQNTSFSLRGFSQDIGTQPTVGVFFADVVAPRGPSQGTAAGDGAGPGDFFDLQNVQVLKGPQGTLFGRNTTGGDVLLVPQKPTDEFGGYVQGSFGNYNMRGGQGVINIPVDDQIRLRFGIDHMSRDGYIHNTSGIGPSDFENVNYTALRASADIDVTSDLENYTIASYTTSSTNGGFQPVVACDPTGSTPPPNKGGTIFVGVGGACGQLTPGAKNFQGAGFYDAAQVLPDPYDNLSQWRVINTTTWHVNDELTVKNIASYAQIKQSLSNPLFGTNLGTQFGTYSHLLSPFLFPFAQETLLPGIPNTDESTYSEEFQLQGNEWDNRLIWQAGLYLEGSDPLATVGYQSQELLACSNPVTYKCTDYLGGFAGQPVGGISYGFGRTSYTDYAGYAQTTYKLTDEFKVTGGIRYTQDRQLNTSAQKTYNFVSPTGGPLPAPGYDIFCTFPYSGAALSNNCTRHLAARAHAPTWLLRAEYTPTDDILAYASYTRGYRAGAITQNIPPPYTAAGPERVDAYEVGLKTSFDAPVQGTFNVDGFYNDFANQQVLIGFLPQAGATVAPTAASINAGKSHIFGGELESTIIPYDGVTLNFAYTYLYAYLIAVRQLPASRPPYNIVGSIHPGDPLEASPRDKLSFTPAYTLPVDDSIGQIILSATFTHTDRQLTNYEDRGYPANAPFVGFGPLSSMSYIPATNLLDLNVNWNSIAGKPVDLSFFATNVTGEKYYTWFPGLATDTGFETAEIGAPCFYGVRLKIHFGED